MRARPVVLQREVGDHLARELFLLVPDAGIDRQAVADLPRVLREEIEMLLPY